MVYQCVYRTTHQFKDYTISLSFIRDQPEKSMDVTEDFSQRPHSERRAFMQKIHEGYQQTRCMNQIELYLQESEYYSHLKQQGYQLSMLMLSAESDVYHYHCYMR